MQLVNMIMIYANTSWEDYIGQKLNWSTGRLEVIFFLQAELIFFICHIQVSDLGDREPINLQWIVTFCIGQTSWGLSS